MTNAFTRVPIYKKIGIQFYLMIKFIYSLTMEQRGKGSCTRIRLFVCFGFIVLLEDYSLIWRRHHYR